MYQIINYHNFNKLPAPNKMENDFVNFPDINGSRGLLVSQAPCFALPSPMHQICRLTKSSGITKSLFLAKKDAYHLFDFTVDIYLI